MTTGKEKVRLTAEEETLLITLFSKTHARTKSIIDDPKSQELLDQIEYDFSQLGVPLGTLLTVCIRAKQLDDYVNEFLDEYPDGVVLHLGCGLDTRYNRVDNGQVEWYDLDLPGGIALRKKFYQEADRYHMIPSSVMDFGWMEEVPKDRAVFVVAEGLLMYLREEEVKSLLLKLKEEFPGCRLAIDVFSTLTAKNVNRHPSLKKTGATVHWGIDDPKEIESWAEGIHLVEEWFFNQSEYIEKLDLGNRLMFWVTGFFMVAKRAQRILYYTL
jgi:O-methyltransferase involved in polyketide biosynthesis